ncbi:MAB_1171c family putative transporter [Streptomyces sp. NPDC050095]|uniref:MAB_1171c family putative transporter n=1 Tax=unclassified Streptomyces TaxID=2593676 RepID=UPI00342A3508
MIALALIVGLTFVLLLGWKISQFTRSPHDAPLRAITLCLTSGAASFILALPPMAQGIRSVAGTGAPRLVQNAFNLGMFFWLMCFYLYSSTNHRTARAHARRETLPLALAVLGLLVTTLAAAGHDTGANYEKADLRVGALAAFYLIAYLYLTYAQAVTLRWTWRYARASRHALAWGLRLMAAAIAVISAANAARAVLTVIRWRGAFVPSTVTGVSGGVIAVAVPLFLLGAAYPAVHARLSVVRIRRYRRRVYHRLYPLWSLLHETYPQDALDRDRSRPWALPRRPRSVDRRYYRRAIECRDGLVRISPYLGQVDTAAMDLSDVSADRLADQLHKALRAQANSEKTQYGAVAVAVPRAQGLDADVQQLVKLSDALERRTARLTAPDKHQHPQGNRRD